jgi:DNA polymerase III subunit gamma/tau
VLKPLKPLGAEFARELAAAARQATGRSWEVRLTDEGGAPSLQQQEMMAEERMRSAVLEEPNVKALLEEFPDATLETIDRKEA